MTTCKQRIHRKGKHSGIIGQDMGNLKAVDRRNREETFRRLYTFSSSSSVFVDLPLSQQRHLGGLEQDL